MSETETPPQGFSPTNADEVRVTALMNVLYYAQGDDLQGLLAWSRLLVRAEELSDDSPQNVQEAIAEVLALSACELPADRERLEESFERACRMLGLEPS